MESKLKIGVSCTLSKIVESHELAANVGSGEVEVFSTPMLIAFMENTAWKAIAPYLADGESSVGVAVDVEHIAPSLLGAKIKATATLVEIDRRILIFELIAEDESGLIGRGSHRRAIINVDKFMQKARLRSGLDA